MPNELLSWLRAHGQCLDFEIAHETGVTVHEVRERFTALVASNDVIGCKVTRFDKGAPVDSMMYRACGYVPPAARGRKPQAGVVTSATLPGATVPVVK